LFKARFPRKSDRVSLKYSKEPYFRSGGGDEAHHFGTAVYSRVVTL